MRRKVTRAIKVNTVDSILAMLSKFYKEKYTFKLNSEVVKLGPSSLKSDNPHFYLLPAKGEEFEFSFNYHTNKDVSSFMFCANEPYDHGIYKILNSITVNPATKEVNKKEAVDV